MGQQDSKLEPLTDDSPMPFGEHKTRKMQYVPPDYLLWLYDQFRKDMNKSVHPTGQRKQVFDYIVTSWRALMQDRKDYYPEFQPSR